MMMMAAVVAAGEQSARCEKGDGCGEFLLVLQSKYTSPCHGDQLLSFARIVTCEGWKLVSKGLERHDKFSPTFPFACCGGLDLYASPDFFRRGFENVI